MGVVRLNRESYAVINSGSPALLEQRRDVTPLGAFVLSRDHRRRAPDPSVDDGGRGAARELPPPIPPGVPAAV